MGWIDPQKEKEALGLLIAGGVSSLRARANRACGQLQSGGFQERSCSAALSPPLEAASGPIHGTGVCPSCFRPLQAGAIFRSQCERLAVLLDLCPVDCHRPLQAEDVRKAAQTLPDPRVAND